MNILYRLYLWRIKSPRRDPNDFKEVIISDNLNILRQDDAPLKYLKMRVKLAFKHKPESWNK